MLRPRPVPPFHSFSFSRVECKIEGRRGGFMWHFKARRLCRRSHLADNGLRIFPQGPLDCQQKRSIMVRMKTARKIEAIDLFCGIGGLTKGLQQAGIRVVAGIDNDEKCKYGYERSNKTKL